MYYKVVATVSKVNRPISLEPSKPAHVKLPCRMYEIGDRIVIQDNQIDMSETTGALCLSLLASMIPVLKAMQRSVEALTEKDTGERISDSTQKVRWFSCPDAERPVIFKIERIPLKGKPGWVVAEEEAMRRPERHIHLHTPNPNDGIQGIQNNLWKELVEKEK